MFVLLLTDAIWHYYCTSFKQENESMGNGMSLKLFFL